MSTDIKRISTMLGKYSSEVLTAIGIVGVVAQSIMTAKQEPGFWLTMYGLTGSEYYYDKYVRMTKSNNWLRMHGYPMRRKH